jgi:hypothetical protein
MRVRQILIAAGLALLAWVTEASASPPAAVVEWRNQRITVRPNGNALDGVLAAIAHETGAQLLGRLPADIPRPSGDFEALSLEAALTRLLGGASFTLRYGAGDRVVSIQLVNEGGAPQPLASTATPAAAPRDAAALEDPTSPLDVLGASIPVRGRLRRRLGAHASLRDVISAALAGTDASERRAASAAIVRAAIARDEIAGFLANAFGALDDDALGRMFAPGDRRKASALAARLARGTRVQHVEARFQHVRDTLASADDPDAR